MVSAFAHPERELCLVTLLLARLSSLLASLAVIAPASAVFRLRLVVHVDPALGLGLETRGRSGSLIDLLGVLLLGLMMHSVFNDAQMEMTTPEDSHLFPLLLLLLLGLLGLLLLVHKLDEPFTALLSDQVDGPDGSSNGSRLFSGDLGAVLLGDLVDSLLGLFLGLVDELGLAGEHGNAGTGTVAKVRSTGQGSDDAESYNDGKVESVGGVPVRSCKSGQVRLFSESVPNV